MREKLDRLSLKLKPSSYYLEAVPLLVLLLMVLLPILVLGCKSSSRSAELTIRNDIQDKVFNKIVVDEIYYSTGIALNKYTLSPGDEIALPYPKISRLQVTREYQGHSNVYVVSCPSKKKGVLIKLIDIHLNRMPGGCLLARVGEEKDGIIRWK